MDICEICGKLFKIQGYEMNVYGVACCSECGDGTPNDDFDPRIDVEPDTWADDECPF